MSSPVGTDHEFQNLVKLLPAGVFVQVRRTFAFLNDEALRIFGASDQADLLGTLVLDRVPPRFQAVAADRIRRLNEAKEIVGKSRQAFLRLDGTEVPVEVSAVPYRFHGEDGALVFLRDLTDDLAFRALLEELPAGVFVQTRGRFALVNREARRLLGVEGAETLEGSPVLQHFLEAERPRVMERIRRLNQDRVPVEKVEEHLVRPDGSTLAVEVSAVPYTFEGVDGALVFLRDLSDDRNFQSLIENIPAGILLRTGPTVVLANKESRRILGAHSEAEILGDQYLTRLPAAERPVAAERMRRVDQGQPMLKPAEVTFVRPDGVLVPTEVTSIPFAFRNQFGALIYMRDLTEDKNYRALIENLPIGVLIGTEECFRYLNAEALRIFGAQGPDQLLGTPVRNRIPAHWRPKLKASMRATFEDHRPTPSHEERFLRLDGTEIVVESSAVPFHFEGKEGLLVFLRDLTAEREAQRQLNLKDELLRLTGSMARVGGWEFDARTFEGTWTEEVAQIHDLDPGEGTNVSLGVSFYTPESRAQVEAAITAAVGQAQAYDLVLEMVTAKGNRKWIRTQGTPLVEDGVVTKVRGTFQDITDLHLAAQATLEEKERLSVTLRSIGDGVITTDTEGLVVLMSRSAEELTGWTQAEAVGRPLTQVMPLIHEWSKEKIENPVEKVLREGVTVELANHTALLTKDGQERVIADSAAPIRDQNDQVTGVVLVFRDMTEKQKLQEALQRAQNLESIGLLAAGIAHDFNNLLSGLFGQVQLAAEKVRRGRIEEAAINFERALGVFDRAKDLTGQLLTFSKGGAPVRSRFDLGALARKTALFALSGSNVRVRFDIAPDLFPCEGDQNQLAQAIDNLVINARQAMAGGGRIEIQVANHEDPTGRWVVLSVKDEGPGLAPGVLDRIFDPFFSTKAGGHGIGLAAVQSIVQRHEGRVEVESTPGRGARFRIYLPAG